MLTKVVTKEEALELPKSCRLAMVSGSFDLLHPGHLYLFNQAKESTLDAKLLVLILDDVNIKRRKGPKRPINSLRLRIGQLQDVKFVDYILPWIEKWEDIAGFVATLKPNYFVATKGDPGITNKRKTIETYGGKFLVIEKLPGFSTSEILKRL